MLQNGGANREATGEEQLGRSLAAFPLGWSFQRAHPSQGWSNRHPQGLEPPHGLRPGPAPETLKHPTPAPPPLPPAIAQPQPLPPLQPQRREACPDPPRPAQPPSPEDAGFSRAPPPGSPLPTIGTSNYSSARPSISQRLLHPPYSLALISPGPKPILRLSQPATHPR